MDAPAQLVTASEDLTSTHFVLLVEAHDDEATLIKSAFGTVGLSSKVTRVKNAADALDFLNCRGEYAGRTRVPPTVVLLDLGSPAGAGIEMVKALRADRMGALVPIVAMTGSSSAGHTRKTLAPLVNGYVRKPIGAASVMSVWRYWTGIKEMPRL